MARTIPDHTLTITVHVPEWVPTHAERGHEDPAFMAARARLVADGHGHCYGCALAGRTVTAALQCHHFAVEWAEWDAADPAAVLRAMIAWDPYGYAAADPHTPVTSPSDVRNLLMLCAACHLGAPGAVDATGSGAGGIHYAPLPIWLADRVRHGTPATSPKEDKSCPPDPTSKPPS